MGSMSPRVLLSFATVLVAGTAYAQAPGQYAPPSAPGYAQPPPQTVAVVAPPARVERRWSIGLAAGQLELTPDGYDEARQTFDMGQLAVRYRPWRHLELELTLGGGHEYLEGGEEGDYAVAMGTLAARYRFNPHESWNWWLLAGFGQTTVAPRTSTQQDIDAAARAHGTLGVGIEKRWTRFALQFELRAIATGPTQAELDAETQYGYMPGPGLSGGNFTFGANYYF